MGITVMIKNIEDIFAVHAESLFAQIHFRVRRKMPDTGRKRIKINGRNSLTMRTTGNAASKNTNSETFRTKIRMPPV